MNQRAKLALVTAAAVTIFTAASLIVAVVLAEDVGAWPGPDVEAVAVDCPSTGVVVTMTNRETGNPGSPGHGKVLSVYPDFPTTDFDPAVMPNTGNSTSSIFTAVPSDFEGTITWNLQIHWYGTDGADHRDVQAQLYVHPCPPPPTTTSSTTTSTTTTTMPTTTTTVPETTTTTVPETTTTTVPSTTTTEPPSTTTTEPPVPLIPPVVIEAPPAQAVPAKPVFTG